MMKATSAVFSNPRFALAGRHGHSVLTSSASASAAGKAFSSRFAGQQQASPNNWTDVQDELKDLQHLMTEHRTNHAIPKLDETNPAIVGQVHDLMSSINTNHIGHDEAFQRAHQLKALVKDALYYHPNHNHDHNNNATTTGRRMMSTMVDNRPQQQDQQQLSKNKNKWADIDNEIDQLRHVMNEWQTNHAVACPQQQLEDLVRSNMDEIFRMQQSNNDDDWVTHDEAIRKVRLLKNLVKAELYRKDATTTTA